MNITEKYQKLSERWIREGLAYKKALNAWLDQMYIFQNKDLPECPTEPRKDMSDAVKEIIVTLNQEEELDALKALFPADSDPMNWQGNIPVTQVRLLDEHRMAVVYGAEHQKRQVYIIDGKEPHFQEGLCFFGSSYGKYYYAKVYADKIVVTEGWDGSEVKTFLLPLSRGADFGLQYPHLKDGLLDMNFEAIRISNLVVFNDGQSIAFASRFGYFVMEDDKVVVLEPESLAEIMKRNEEEDNDIFITEYNYPHLDVSPDGKYIALGSQDSPHLVYEKNNDVWEVVTTVYPRSSYPNLARFNYNLQEEAHERSGPQLLLSSCHFSRSGSVCLPIQKIVKDAEYDAYDADENLNYVNEGKWIFSALPLSFGYALGDNNGYVWFNNYGTYHPWGYLHVGATVMSMDMTADRKKLVIANYSGEVIVYELGLFSDGKMFRNKDNITDAAIDAYAITNMQVKEISRYIFHEGTLLLW